MLYVDNDSNLEVLGLASEDGVYVTDAAITCTIIDTSGNLVATVALAYLGAGKAVGQYPDGNYRGVLSGSNVPALVAGTTYQQHFVASNYGFVADRYEVAQARVG